MDLSDENNSKAGPSSGSKHPSKPHQPPAGIVTSQNEAGPVVINQEMGSDRVPLICSSCHARVVTRLERKPIVKTHLIAGLLCLTGLWCCVCCPYWKDCFHNAVHYCPNCDVYLGSYID